VNRGDTKSKKAGATGAKEKPEADNEWGERVGGESKAKLR